MIRTMVMVVMLAVLTVSAYAAKDTIRVGHPTTCTAVTVSTASVSMPVYLVDRPGTPVGSDAGAGREIHGFSLRVRPTPQEAIDKNSGMMRAEWFRAGVTSSMSPSSENTGANAVTVTWAIQFGSPIPISLNTTTRVGTLKIYLTPGLTVGTRIDLTVDPERLRTQLMDSTSVTIESVPAGDLSLVSGCIVVQ